MTVDSEAQESHLRAVRGVQGVERSSAQIDSLLEALDWVGGIVDRTQTPPLGGVEEGDEYPTIEGAIPGEFAGPAVYGAINMSIEPSDSALLPSIPDDSINHATKYLSAFTVPVVAAGNQHELGAEWETLSPWSEPDWVLSVGATEDDAVTTEAAFSGRSVRGGVHIGPDILAWGNIDPSHGEHPELHEHPPGTSYAAARASFFVLMCRLYLLMVNANLARARGLPFGVPLVGWIQVDRFKPNVIAKPSRIVQIPALPVKAAEPEEVEKLKDIDAEQLSDPSTAREMVKLIAQATRPSSNTSAPGLNWETLARFLNDVTAGSLKRLLAGSEASLGHGDAPSLMGRSISHILRDTLVATAPIWQWDLNHSRWRSDYGFV